MVDRLGNWCEGLPKDINVTLQPPQLTLQTLSTSDNKHTARFAVSQSEDNEHVYGGRWELRDNILRMPDLAIVGPPGTVCLTLSGGSTEEGQPLKLHALSLELQLGKPTKAGIYNWPSGTCLQLLCQVRACLS